MRHLFIPICLAAALSCACTSSSDRFDKGASALMDKFSALAAEGKIMYGHQDDLMYGHTWRVAPDESGFTRSDVKESCGKYPAILGMDLGGIELDHECNLDGNKFEHIRAAAVKHHERGGVVTFSWHARNPLTGGDAWDVSSKEVVASILEGGSKYEYFQSWLCKLADYLDTFRDSEGELIPIIFRPWHEHTGSWFWWGEDLCSEEQFKALWKMTFDYLCHERGLHNLLWSYSPGAGGISVKRIAERYPGDEMVDILGVDYYQYTDSEQFIKELSEALDILGEFSRAHDKLFALTEAGYESIPQADWWTAALYPALKEGSVPVYVLTWRNACDRPEHFYAPFPGQESAEDFARFADKEDIVLL